MATTKAIDVSHWQGSIDWKRVKAAGYNIAIIKVSGGDAGLYFDSRAAANYKNAKAAGLAVGMYHFAGKHGAVIEADHFIKAVSPIAENDVLVLDWEKSNKPSAAEDQWCADFINRVKSKLGVTPMVYMNTSSENYISWVRTRATNAGLWIADYRYTASQNVPIKHWPFYFIHQFTSSGKVPGITGNVDLDSVKGTVDTFKKYGYHKPAPKPEPKPTPKPVVTTKTVTETKLIDFEKVTVTDNMVEEGKSFVSVPGVPGVMTYTYKVTYTDGKETKRELTSQAVTKKPVNEVTTVGTKSKEDQSQDDRLSALEKFMQAVKDLFAKIGIKF